MENAIELVNPFCKCKYQLVKYENKKLEVKLTSICDFHEQINNRYILTQEKLQELNDAKDFKSLHLDNINNNDNNRTNDNPN